MINTTPFADSASAASARNPRTPRRVARCEVIVVAPESRVAHDLLPWADPYIASLMAKLEREESEA